MATLAAAEPYLTSVFYNPALLGKLQTKTLQFTTELGFADDTMAGFYYACPTALHSGAVMMGLSYYDAGAVELSWLSSDDELFTRNVSLQRDALGIVSFGRQLNDAVCFGSSVKIAGSDIAETRSAAAMAIDAGLLYMPAYNVTLSAALLNLGGATKFIDTAEPLPQMVSLGAGVFSSVKGVSVFPALVANYSFVDEEFGVESGVRFGSETVGITAGYRSLAAVDALLMGVDLTVGGIEFGYSYSPGYDISASHRANISCRFSGTSLPRVTEKKRRSRSRQSDTWYQRQMRETTPWYK